MTKPIAIILGEPNSISSEIIFKSWIKKKKFKHHPCLVIGNYNLLYRHLKYFKLNLKLKLIEKTFKLEDLKGTAIPVIDIKYNQKKIFEKISKKSNKFILNSFSEGLNLLKQNKILGIINGPVSKETLLNKKFNGITEFIAHKIGCYNKVAMLIYSKKLAVTPITTHIPVKKISSKSSKDSIYQKISDEMLAQTSKFHFCTKMTSINWYMGSICLSFDQPHLWKRGPQWQGWGLLFEVAVHSWHTDSITTPPRGETKGYKHALYRQRLPVFWNRNRKAFPLRWRH